MLNIETWLETTGLKAAEKRFIKSPPPPYILFSDDTQVSGADNKNCIADRSISIELYSLKVDHVLEKSIEDLLNEKAIQFKRDRIWIDTEMLFSTIYDFNFVEKF